MEISKIKNRKQILKLVKKFKKQKKKIVFTNGCYDLFHAGHLEVLKKAKSTGDVLIVGINSDKSIRELKGPERPIVQDKYRASIIAGLDCVDFVIIFNEVSVINLVKALCPDVLVKGGQYKIKEVVGWQYAGEIVRVPILKGYSTTATIDKIVSIYGKK